MLYNLFKIKLTNDKNIGVEQFPNALMISTTLIIEICAVANTHPVRCCMFSSYFILYKFVFVHFMYPEHLDLISKYLSPIILVQTYFGLILIAWRNNLQHPKKLFMRTRGSHLLQDYNCVIRSKWRFLSLYIYAQLCGVLPFNDG